MTPALVNRVAAALGWSEADVRSIGARGLRDLVRPVSAKLAHELDLEIRSGASLLGEKTSEVTQKARQLLPRAEAPRSPGIQQGGAAVARQAHNLEVPGSNPGPATSELPNAEGGGAVAGIRNGAVDPREGMGAGTAIPDAASLGKGAEPLAASSASQARPALTCEHRFVDGQCTRCPVRALWRMALDRREVEQIRTETPEERFHRHYERRKPVRIHAIRTYAPAAKVGTSGMRCDQCRELGAVFRMHTGKAFCGRCYRRWVQQREQAAS